MQFRFTKHALVRMKERNITVEAVRSAVRKTDSGLRSTKNKTRFIAKKISANGKRLLMVIYEVRGREIIIITVIDTTKVQKYY